MSASCVSPTRSLRRLRPAPPPEVAPPEPTVRREFSSAPLVGAVALALGASYWRTGKDLLDIWWNDPNYSHGFVVPLFSLYLAWSARRAAPATESADEALNRVASDRSWLRGLTKVVVGLCLHLVAAFLGHGFLDVLALVCIVRGATLLVGGESAHRRYAPATLFLIFMARLPILWYQAVARFLQNLVCVASAACFEACGIPVCREGCNLHFPGYSLTVGEACSGMRQLTTAVALAFVLGHFFTKSRTHRAILLVAGIPVAVVANCLRVVAAGFALRWCGPETAEGILHTLEGLATMSLVSILLFGLARYLSSCSSNEPGTHDSDHYEPASPASNSHAPAAAASVVTVAGA